MNLITGRHTLRGSYLDCLPVHQKAKTLVSIRDSMCLYYFHDLNFLWLSSLSFLLFFVPSPPPQVYCAGMQTDMPQEYITLTTGEGENFSEVFGFR